MADCIARKIGEFVLVSGNTFPIEYHLKYLGGSSDSAKKEWFIPASKEELVMRLIGDCQDPYCLSSYHDLKGSEVLEFVERQDWTFAKTMPHLPHWYIVRNRVGDDEMFNSFVMYVHCHGEVSTRCGGRFRRKYLTVGDFYYWTMDPPTFPANFTELVNRARLGDDVADFGEAKRGGTMNNNPEPLPEVLKRFVTDEKWTYAKTMPTWPHEYLVRERVDEELFVKMVTHIRANGYEGRFYQMRITYFEEDGLVYWTMGAPPNETIIINRCRKEDTFESRLANGTLPG